ncbi:hypothetical protein KIW84_031683, partial [Lathyrus oleraceus]
WFSLHHHLLMFLLSTIITPHSLKPSTPSFFFLSTLYKSSYKLRFFFILLIYMDLKPYTIFTNCFFLFLILMTLPYFSKGGSEALNSEIYEIDYRGPETHSFVPPPNHSHGKIHSPHHKSYADANKAMGLTTTMKQIKVKEAHG